MTCTIAIAGKGGSGKTTIAGLLVRLLKERNLGSILAIDADPNSNLDEALGISVPEGIGDILDELPDAIPAGMSKERYLDYRLQSAIKEADGFDLLLMGKPEGPGCYCYVNNVLRNSLGHLKKDYDFIIIDNEAGLEHFSRRTTRSADILLVISDATSMGLKASRRISELASQLRLEIKKRYLVINRSAEKIALGPAALAGLEYLGNIPEDEQILKLSLKGASLFALGPESPALASLQRIGEILWPN
jgi:CO dehydrogenase maturation factor